MSVLEKPILAKAAEVNLMVMKIRSTRYMLGQSVVLGPVLDDLDFAVSEVRRLIKIRPKKQGIYVRFLNLLVDVKILRSLGRQQKTLAATLKLAEEFE